MEIKKYPLTLDAETFNAFKTDFDQILQALINEMERREEEDAVINIKIGVSLHPDQERDFETNGYDGMKDIIKPTFKHDITSVMNVKQKKSGILGGNMKMVWDKDLHRYVLQNIDNGQISFDQQEAQNAPAAEPAQIPAAEPAQLPAAEPAPDNVIDVTFREVDDSEADEPIEDSYDYDAPDEDAEQ